MLDTAVPPKLRTPEIRALITTAEKGDAPTFSGKYRTYLGSRGIAINAEREKQFQQAEAGNHDALHHLYNHLLARATGMFDDAGPITCEEVIGYLTRQRMGDLGARDELFSYFEQQIDHLIAKALYPGQKSDPKDSMQSAAGATQDSSADTSEPDPVDATKADELWGDLISDIGGAAERLWRNEFLRDDPQESRKIRADEARLSEIGLTTARAHQIWLLWLEASLYQKRASANFLGRQMSGSGFGKDNPTRAPIRDDVRKYLTRLREWDRELYQLTNRHYFLTGFLDSEQFRRLIKQFGEAAPEEVGWLSQAEDAQSELRYQLRDEIVRELWRCRSQPHPQFWRRLQFRLQAATLWLLKVTTGYGTRPANYVRTVLTVIGVDTALFFLNDLLNPGVPAVWHGTLFCPAERPHPTSWFDYVQIFVHYLYIAVTNLTALGSNSSLAAYCGGFSTQVLLVLTSVTGYVLLALLASLLFKLLTEQS